MPRSSSFRPSVPRLQRPHYLLELPLELVVVALPVREVGGQALADPGAVALVPDLGPSTGSVRLKEPVQP